MRLSPRVLSFLIPLAVLIAFIAVVAPRLKQRADTFESLFPRILATELSYYLSQYLGRPVTISAVLVDRKHDRLQFLGITIERRPDEIGPALAKVDRVVVHYDPRFLTLRLFDPLSSIGDMEIFHPDLFVVHDRSGQWNVLNIGKPRQPNAHPGVPLTSNIHVFNAAVTYLDLAPPHTPPYLFTARATGGQGVIALQKNGPVRWKLEALGAPPVPGLRSAFHHATVAGYLDTGDNSADINVVTDRGDMAHILGAYLNVNFARLSSGDATGSLNFYRPPPGPKGPLPWQYVIDADFTDLSGTVHWLQGPLLHASGHAAISGETIQFRIDGVDYGAAHLAGSGVLLDFHQPVINGSFTAARVTQAMIYPFIPANERGMIRLQAPSSGMVTLQGLLSHPDIAGRLNSPSVVVDNIPISDATLGFTYLGGQLSLSQVLFRVGGGSADLTGNLVSTPQGPVYRLSGFLQDIDLSRLPLPPSFAKYRASGQLTGNVQLTGAGKSFNLFTRFAARNTQFTLNATPYFARSASGVLRATSGPSGLTAASTNLKANGLLIVMNGERYSADGISGVVNARLGVGGLQSLVTQGSLSQLTGRGMDLKSAAWNVMPMATGENSIELSVSDPTGQVQLAGTGTTNMSSIKLQALARNVQIASLGRFIPALRPVGGIAFVNGTLNGSLARPVFNGDVQALGVTYSGMKFDRIHGGVTLSPSGAQLRDITMHIFPGQIVLNGAVSMNNYHPTDTNIQIAARDLSLSRLASLEKMKLPVTGNASGDIAIQGPPTHPLIAGRLNVMNGVLGSYPVSTATAEFRYEPDLQQFHTGMSPATLLAGLELTSVTAASPDATFTLTGGRIGQDGRLNMHADLTNIAFLDLWESLSGKQELSPQILPLQNGRVALQVFGTVTRPRLVAQLPPTQVDVNGQKMIISAQNLSIVPQLSPPVDAAHKGGFSLAALAVDQITLQHVDPSGMPAGFIRIVGSTPNQAAVLMPHVAAVVEVSQMNMDTAAGLVRQSLPRGFSGMISGGRLTLSGDLPMPNTTGAPLQLLRGAASLTLRDVALVPPSSGPIIPIPYTVPPAPGAGGTITPPPATIPVEAPAAAHTTLSAFRPFGRPRSRPKHSDAPGPIAPPVVATPVSEPTPAGVHFAIGQFNARLEGKRVTLDVAHLYQFDNSTAPGIRLEVAPGSYYDVGGGMSVTAEAPGIPVALVNQLFPLFSPPKSATAPTSTSQFTDLANRIGGSVHLAAQVTQATEDLSTRVLTLSIDPSITDPLMYSGRPLLARAVVQAVEGSLALRTLALGTRIGTAEHLVTGSGNIPFTWLGANHIPANGALKFHAQLANDNLSALQAVAPEMVQSATGSLTAEITVGGTLQSPRVFGAVLVGDTAPGKLVLQHIEQPLQNVRLAINFDDRQATVKGSAASDKGTMTLGGTAQIPGASRPGTVDLSLKTDGFHLTDQGLYANSAYQGDAPNPQQLKKYYEQVYGYVDSAISVKGPLDSPLVSGAITLRNADLRYGGSPENAAAQPAAHTINPRFRLDLTLGQPGLLGKDISVIHTSLAKINPYGTLKVTGNLDHPVMDGEVNIRKGGYVNYVLALWQVEQATAHVHYEPPLAPGENGLKLNASGVLKTEVEEQGSGKTTAFFAPSGQLLSVRMQVIGDPLVKGGFHILLTSDPPRSDAQLRNLLFHTDILKNIEGGNFEGQVPGLFNEALRNTLFGNVLNPLESKVAGFLGLEEVNLQYQFGGPLFLQISKHWFDGVSIRFRRELSAGAQEYQAYLDYRVHGNLNFSLGLLQRPTYQEGSFTLQTFFRF